MTKRQPPPYMAATFSATYRSADHAQGIVRAQDTELRKSREAGGSDRGQAEYNLRTAKYNIGFAENALEDLTWFKKNKQNEIRDGIYENLQYEPTVETRNRKRLRPNTTPSGN